MKGLENMNNIIITIFVYDTDAVKLIIKQNPMKVVFTSNNINDAIDFLDEISGYGDIYKNGTPTYRKRHAHSTQYTYIIGED